MSRIDESTLDGDLQPNSVFIDSLSGKEYQIIGRTKIAEIGRIVPIRNVGKKQDSKLYHLRLIGLENKFVGSVRFDEITETPKLEIGQEVGLLGKNEEGIRRMFLKTDKEVIPFLDSLK